VTCQFHCFIPGHSSSPRFRDEPTAQTVATKLRRVKAGHFGTALHDAGNTTTLAGYLHLLGTAFLVSGLELYSAGQGRKRGSSPKFVHWNNALVSALARRPFSQARADAAWWGRLVENAVGGWLLNSLSPTEWEVGYWRKANAEVDFVVSRGREAIAIEVKSGRPGKPDGMAAFCRTYPRARPLIIGGGGLPLEEFFASWPERWLDQR